MRRYFRFLTAMVSTYQQWLRMVEQREQLVSEYGKSGAPLPSRSIVFPHGWPHEHLVERALAEILIDQKQILANQARSLKNQEKIMSALTDLQKKISDLATDVDDFIAANQGGASDSDLVAMGTQVDGIASKLVPPAPTE